ncbi:MAG: amidohydrolase [Solobacterium sp.]|nr:amidohydrolase [Solobacterium sp.]
MAATKVLINGNIHTVDACFRTVHAMAIEGDKILYAGDNEKALSFAGSETVVEDLQGKTVTPGFIDNHVHAKSTGYNYSRMSCENLSKEEILEGIAKLAKEAEPGEWIVTGTGWDNDWWEDTSYPSMEELDAVSPNNPVICNRKAGGVTWINSKALEALGYSGIDDPALAEARITNPDGKLSTGCLVGYIRRFFNNSVGTSEKNDIKAMQALQDGFFAMGLTSFTEASLNGDDLKFMEKLYEDGTLTIRMHAAVGNAFGNDNIRQQSSVEYLKKCPIVGAYGDRFNVRTIKMMAAGTFGSRNSCMYESFTDNPGNCGTPTMTNEELYEGIKYGSEHGMQVMIHTIGDLDLDRVLDAYEKVNEETPIKELRHRIEHFQIIRGNTPERAKALGIIPSVQPLHGPNSSNMAEKCLGPFRAPYSYPIGQLAKRVGMIAGGSDSPVANAAPLSGIHAAVTRKNDNLQPENGFYPELGAMDRESALKAFTIWGAYAQFGEERYGSLEPGKYADYVVMDKDLLTVEADEILNIQVLETVMGGKTVYKKQ